MQIVVMWKLNVAIVAMALAMQRKHAILCKINNVSYYNNYTTCNI